MNKNKLYSYISLFIIFLIVLLLIKRENNTIEEFNENSETAINNGSSMINNGNSMSNSEIEKIIEKQNYVINVDNLYNEIVTQINIIKTSYDFYYKNDEYDLQFNQFARELPSLPKKKKTEIKYTNNFPNYYTSFNELTKHYNNRERDSINIIGRVYNENLIKSEFLKDDDNKVCSDLVNSANRKDKVSSITQIKCQFDLKLNNPINGIKLLRNNLIFFLEKINCNFKNSIRKRELDNRKSVVNEIIINKIQKPIKIFGNNMATIFKEGRIDIGKFQVLKDLY